MSHRKFEKAHFPFQKEISPSPDSLRNHPDAGPDAPRSQSSALLGLLVEGSADEQPDRPAPQAPLLWRCCLQRELSPHAPGAFVRMDQRPANSKPVARPARRSKRALRAAQEAVAAPGQVAVRRLASLPPPS